MSSQGESRAATTADATAGHVGITTSESAIVVAAKQSAGEGDGHADKRRGVDSGMLVVLLKKSLRWFFSCGMTANMHSIWTHLRKQKSEKKTFFFFFFFLVSTGRFFTLPLSFDDDSVVTASEGVIVVQRTVGELVKANLDEFFQQRSDASKNNVLAKWINDVFTEAKLLTTESKFTTCWSPRRPIQLSLACSRSNG
jgi:hypothetical protein